MAETACSSTSRAFSGCTRSAEVLRQPRNATPRRARRKRVAPTALTTTSTPRSRGNRADLEEVRGPRRSQADGSGDCRLEHSLRLRDAVALRVVDAEAGEHLDDLGVLGPLGDGPLAGEMPDLVDRANHLAVDRVAQYLSHEAAVDLEKVDREMLEVTERGQPPAEVIERELATLLLQRLDEAVRLRIALHCGRFGDLETDLRGVEAAVTQLLDHERQKLLIAKALSREVDRALREFLALIRLGDQPTEGVLDHPPIDRRGDTVALGGGNEVVRLHQVSGLVLETQQQLVVRAALGSLQRLYCHAEQLEATFLERSVDARRPLHLLAPPHELDVVLGKAVHAVAAILLGRRAGTVCGREHAGDVLVVGRDRHDPDARAETKNAILPGEAEIAHRLPQCLCGAHRLIERAALEEDAELVAAEPRKRVAPAHLGFQQRTHLPEQGIACAVATGIVDDLELIDVEIAERVGGFACLRALQRALEAGLELAPVDEPGEQVVARVIRQPPVELA